jgi:hypothetical protein
MIFADVERCPVSNKYFDNFKLVRKLSRLDNSDIYYCWKIIKPFPDDLLNNTSKFPITFVNLFLNVCTDEERKDIIKQKDYLRMKVTNKGIVIIIKRNIVDSGYGRLYNYCPVGMIPADITLNQCWYYIGINETMFLSREIDKYHIIYNIYEKFGAVIPGVKILCKNNIDTPRNIVGEIK